MYKWIVQGSGNNVKVYLYKIIDFDSNSKNSCNISVALYWNIAVYILCTIFVETSNTAILLPSKNSSL